MSGRRHLLSLLLIILVLVWVRPTGVMATPDDHISSERESDYRLEQLDRTQQAAREQFLQSAQLDGNQLPGMNVANGQALLPDSASVMDDVGGSTEEIRQAILDEQLRRRSEAPTPGAAIGENDIVEHAERIRQAALDELLQGVNSSGDLPPGMDVANREALSTRTVVGIDRDAESAAAGIWATDPLATDSLRQQYADEMAEVLQMGSRLALESEQQAGSSPEIEAMFRDYERLREQLLLVQTLQEVMQEQVAADREAMLATLQAIRSSMNEVERTIRAENI